MCNMHDVWSKHESTWFFVHFALSTHWVTRQTLGYRLWALSALTLSHYRGLAGVVLARSQLSS